MQKVHCGHLGHIFSIWENRRVDTKVQGKPFFKGFFGSQGHKVPNLLSNLDFKKLSSLRTKFPALWRPGYEDAVQWNRQHCFSKKELFSAVSSQLDFRYVAPGNGMPLSHHAGQWEISISSFFSALFLPDHNRAVELIRNLISSPSLERLSISFIKLPKLSFISAFSLQLSSKWAIIGLTTKRKICGPQHLINES